jgi:small-conductance mechanosensitive channel
VVIAAALLVLLAADRLLLRRDSDAGGENKLIRQLILLLLTGVAVVLVVLTLPVAESTRNQLLALLGLVLTALLTLSSTTFVANAMAGIMLRSVNNLRPGDFVRVGENFGRVTVRGLFHTEVQTEDSDLTTLPNLLLVSNPVTVVRATGTIVSATVSLGYDNAHSEVEPILLEAAAAAELADPFVQVVDLADHAVGYRVAGFLTDVKRLLTARSNLRRSVLDALHGAGVEIVSPNFMNQRVLTPGARVVPHAAPSEPAAAAPPTEGPDEMVFDKAEAAERARELRESRQQVAARIKELEESVKKAEGEDKTRLERELEVMQTRLARMDRQLEPRS